MKLAAIIAAVVVSMLAITYSAIFILVRAQVEQYPGGLDFTMITRRASDHTEATGRNLVLKLGKGAEYGWICIRKTTRADLSWQESFTIPSRAASWKHHNLIGVSADGRTVSSSGTGVIVPPRTFSEVLERLCFVKTVFWQNMWSVAEGDPAGDYVFTVTFDGESATRTIQLTTD